MRALIIGLFLLINSPIFASEITCYSHGRIIYKGITNDVYYNDNNTFIVKDKRTHKEVIIWASECVIKL